MHSRNGSIRQKVTPLRKDARTQFATVLNLRCSIYYVCWSRSRYGYEIRGDNEIVYGFFENQYNAVSMAMMEVASALGRGERAIVRVQ